MRKGNLVNLVSAERDPSAVRASESSCLSHTPATPLPWRSEHERALLRFFNQGNTNENARQNAAYLTHAANAYPRLVAALRAVSVAEVNGPMIHVTAQTEAAQALLRELGEEA